MEELKLTLLARYKYVNYIILIVILEKVILRDSIQTDMMFLI